MAQLSTAVEQVDAPPRLRAALLEAAAATPQMHAPHSEAGVGSRVPLLRKEAPGPELPRRDEAATPQAPDRAAAATAGREGSATEQTGLPQGASSGPASPRHRRAAPTSRPGLSGPGRTGRLRPRRLIASALAVAAVVIIGGLGIRTIQLQQRLEAAAAQASTTADLLREVARPGVSHALLARPDGAAVAAVVLSNGRREVYTLGLAANAADHSYVLWGLKGTSSAPQPLGAFDVASGGAGAQVVGSSGQDDYAAYAVSLEPGHTPPAAPTNVLAAGNLQA
jgi:hypothetical protein